MAKGAMRIYGPPPDDPIRGLVEAKLGLGGRDAKEHRQDAYATVLPRSDVGKVILSVARDPMALGVVDLAQMPPGEASVKVLAIAPPCMGPAAPTRVKLPPGYPLIQPVGLWVSGQASQAAKDFGDYLGSGGCAGTLLRHGLVPKVVPVKKPATGPAASGKKAGK